MYRLLFIAFIAFCLVPAIAAPEKVLKVGTAAVPITPYGPNPDWDGTITPTGVWGEKFTDLNGNGRWDKGEPFEDDPVNDQLDPGSKGKYDGIYLAGFGDNRLATSKHDDLWARALVFDDGVTRFAVVTLDLIGYYSDASFYGLKEVQKLLSAKLGIQEVLLVSTHNHEGPDTIGAWGENFMKDGKYPRYLRFVDRMIAKSIEKAAATLAPARLKLGVTDPIKSPGIARLQVRNGNRRPIFFDEELRVMQFVGTKSGKTIATLINWNTHPESMEDKNQGITSDFPHAARELVEKKYGGMAVYINGAIGAAEIVGDSNTRNTDRINFDGKDYPLKPNSTRPVFTIDRTYAIGREVGKAAVFALEHGEWSKSAKLSLRKADLFGKMDNQGYQILGRLGVLDTINRKEGNDYIYRTNIYAIDIGDAQVVTTPGELFPEIFYGLAKNKRTDCPAADTGAPLEPSIRDAMTGKHRFMFGLCPDEFGYIVPKYDFRREPIDITNPEIRQSPDACKAQGAPNHYQETNSAGSDLAPATACVSVALLTGKLPADAACADAASHSEYVRKLVTAKGK